MIQIKVSVHDKFSFECKISFIVKTEEEKLQEKEFSINTWLFVPNGLDVNPDTHSKAHLNKDVKSNLRFITPTYSLKGIYDKDSGLIVHLKNVYQQLFADPQSQKAKDNFSYHNRMFLAICKSAIRTRAYEIIEDEDASLLSKKVEQYIYEVEQIVIHYRQLRDIIHSPNVAEEEQEQYSFGDEFLGNIKEQQTFRLMKGLSKRGLLDSVKEPLADFLKKEIGYKQRQGYPVLHEHDATGNSLIIIRRGILKKYMESDLFLLVKNSQDGAIARQIYYGIAAGISMFIAAEIGFIPQLKYGGFTTPVFLTLIISYIFKDRIKELVSHYFNIQLGRRYYDTKRKLAIRKQKIGWIKEAFDFVPEKKMPQEVLNIRKRIPLVEAENKVYNEQIILYRKQVSLSSKNIAREKTYYFSGVNDITRFNISSFILKTDNPFIPLYLPNSETGYQQFKGEKVYAIHFVIRCQSKSKLYFHKYRLLFNRDGIKEIKDMSSY